MTAILAVKATPHTLRAVVRDPGVRLWAQLDYRGQPGAQCLVDARLLPALKPPHGPAEAVHLLAELVDANHIAVAAVAHHLPDVRPEYAELIDDTLLVKLADRVALAPALAAIDAARAAWPQVPHIACNGSPLDIEAMMDHQARTLLRQTAASNNRAEQMLADPRGYVAQARERARIEVEEEIAHKARRARSH
jgi:hypothetical protein